MLPVKVWFHLAKRFQRRRFLKIQPIRIKNCPWRPCLSSDRDKMNKFYKGPYIDASCQVWFHLAQQFQRRRLKCEKLTDGRTTDASWWQKLTWPFGSGELESKKFIPIQGNIQYVWYSKEERKLAFLRWCTTMKIFVKLGKFHIFSLLISLHWYTIGLKSVLWHTVHIDNMFVWSGFWADTTGTEEDTDTI